MSPQISQRPVILLINDDIARCKQIAHVLAAEFEIIAAPTDYDAVALAIQRQPHVIVCSDQAPRFSALTFFEQVRLSNSGCIRFLSLARQHDSVLSQETMQGAEIYRLLPEPLDANFLAWDLRRALQHYAAAQRQSRLLSAGYAVVTRLIQILTGRAQLAPPAVVAPALTPTPPPVATPPVPAVQAPDPDRNIAVKPVRIQRNWLHRSN